MAFTYLTFGAEQEHLFFVLVREENLSVNAVLLRAQCKYI